MTPEQIKKLEATIWQSALDDLKADGTFEKIYRRYLPNADLNDLLKK